MDRYELLAAARSELRAMEREQDVMGRESRRYGEPTTYGRGIAAEACHQAEYAIFNVLNVLTNYCDDERARAVLHT
jgi:hypothetical protein